MRKNIYHLFFVLTLSFLLINLVSPSKTWAQVDFDPNYIISDNDMFDYTAMDLEQIQNFLTAKNSGLANYIEPTTSLKASQIIYNATQDYQISPKFLLALLQKEQSLIENSSPSQYAYDWATGYAVCDGCSTNDPLLQRFKGFYNQVYGAAKRIKLSYLPALQNSGKTPSGYGPNISKEIDDIIVRPANNATAILYTYTPHLHGNKLLWTIWNRYYTRNYPDGTLLNVDGSKEVWLIENGERRKFANRSVYLSRYPDFDSLITINKTELLKYPEGNPIKFANYSFLRTPRGTVYLVVGDILRGFSSREALRRVGVNPEEIIAVKQEDIADLPEGQPITTKTVYPLGALLKDSKTNATFWVQNGNKHPIITKEITASNFPGRKVTKVTTKQLAQYPLDAPITFRNGDLVQGASDNHVYLISNQARRPFASLDVLTKLGFDTKNIIKTSDEALLLHELGPTINANF